jgi:hypothetical protein
MADAADLARRILVRHKAAGHLRLELPAELRAGPTAAALAAGLRQLAGVYRVDFEPADGRLSIRYDEHLCSLHQTARHLRGLLDGLDLSPAADQPPAPPAEPPVERLLRLLPRAAQSTLGARLQPVLASALTEKAIINFLNDLVMFYLIKVHWELITKRWLKDPAGHANAWLTTFYLVFLLVRYRKSQK